MAEFGRIARAAFRSNPLMRTSTTTWQSSQRFVPANSRYISATSSLASADGNKTWAPKLPPSKPQQQSYSSSKWAAPSSQSPGQSRSQEESIRKPNMSAYHGAQDQDSLNLGDLGLGSDARDDMSENTSFGQSIDIELDDITQTFKDQIVEPPKPPMRLVPRTGRTIAVTKSTDVARALKILAIQTNQNRVRQDFQKQRYHERPGLKRKRLKSERWVRRFKIGFKATILRVNELTRQGW
ncbi:hypothetical protein F5Y15DRAFT_396525 [Xylariaceae sp. FL0016]|nr:hypothetical protein F5Y15DRAFT_396525 [Xylariaceae sp. FL0016]